MGKFGTCINILNYSVVVHSMCIFCETINGYFAVVIQKSNMIFNDSLSLKIFASNSNIIVRDFNGVFNKTLELENELENILN